MQIRDTSMNELSHLYNLGSKLLDIESVDSVYKTFVSEAADLVGAEVGSVFLYTSGSLQRVYASDKKLYTVVPRPNGLIAKSIKSSIPVVYDVKEAQGTIRMMKMKSVIVIPLIYKKKLNGVLTLLSRKKEMFSDKELRMLRLCGIVASSAIVKAQLTEELKQAVESRDLFIAMASHELKTPLTAITVYAQLLHQKTAKGIIPKKIVANLTGEIGKFNKLVHNLLQLNTIQKGKLSYSFAKCFLEDVLLDAMQVFRTCYPTHSIVIANKHPKRIAVFGDYEKLTQVFTNIFTNAGKFSPDNSSVIVAIKKKKKFVEIRITDKGKGIPKRDIPNVFKKFYKGDNSQPGLGLGLFLVKTIIEDHDGTISFVTKEKKGTTLIIQLPLTTI